MSFEQLLEEYIHLQKKQKEYQQKLERIKSRIKSRLKEEENGMRTCGEYQLQVKTLYKTNLDKKKIPSELLESCTTKVAYDTLYVRKHKKV